MIAPTYYTPDDQTCPKCDQPCTIIPLLNEFDYAGTHCTGGREGTHYPFDWGSPVSNCCEFDINDAVRED